MPNEYSIRSSLQGDLQDFLTTSGFINCTYTAGLVRDLTALLAAYREEDVQLYPSVFVLSTTENFAEIAPGTEHVIIGTKSLEETEASSILKDCAPLAENGWSIFVVKTRDPSNFQYGLFRSLANSFATSAEEAMLQEGSPILAIQNRGHLVVEIRNSKGAIFTASLTSAPAAKSHFAEHVANLIASITERLPPELREPFTPYAKRFLAKLFQRCHGTLCAVLTPPPGNSTPQQFVKSVWLSKPLGWADSHLQARIQKSADALAQLQAVESLITGMIHSDGVVVFGSDGSVLGYRAFLSPTDDERKEIEDNGGGGRRRTYSLMVKRLNSDFRAAFFRSQDGETACNRAES